MVLLVSTNFGAADSTKTGGRTVLAGGKGGKEDVYIHEPGLVRDKCPLGTHWDEEAIIRVVKGTVDNQARCCLKRSSAGESKTAAGVPQGSRSRAATTAQCESRAFVRRP